MKKSVATAQKGIIFGNVESFESIDFSEQNVAKVADPDFEIYCTTIDLAEVMESEYEIHSKACKCDGLAKVVESEYKIHGKACDDLVKVVESEYKIHGMACECDDLVKVVESEYEIHGKGM